MKFLTFTSAAALALASTLTAAQGVKTPATKEISGTLSTELGSGSTQDNKVTLDGIVAIVNNDVITNSELDRQLATIERQMVRKGVKLPPRLELKRQILERMILDKAQLQRADQIGIRIDDKQIDDTIARIARQNQMDLEAFLEKLRQDGIRPEQFRTEIRNELTIAQLKEREVESRLQVSDSEVQAYLANRSKGELSVKPQVNWIQILVKAPQGKEGGPEAEKVEELEQALKKGLTVQEILTTHPELEIEGTGNMGWQSFDDIPSLFTGFLTTAKAESVKTIRSANGYHVLKVLGRKQSDLAGLDTQPVVQTKARHILIRPSDELPEAEVRRQLQFVIDKIKNDGVSFETLARQYSVDGSAAKGGDLGWLYPGDTVPEFERVMNDLRPGEISGITESRFGLHIIKVDDRREKAVSEDRQRIAAKRAILASKSEDAYSEWLRQLRDRTFIEIRL